MSDQYITVFCQARLDRPDLPRGQRACRQMVMSATGVYGPLDPARIRVFDYGMMYFGCGHAADKDNNALERVIEESYKRGHW